jgi:ABC-type amino acid transport substrate-binding protein
MTRVFAFVFLCLAFAASHAHAQNCEGIKTGFDAERKPQNTSRDIVGQSLDEIIDRGFILFAVYEDFAPYSWREDGVLRGVDIELAEIIAEDLGVEARFYETAAGENVDADLRFNVSKGRLIGGQIANVMLHVPYNRELACRNEQVVLTGQYFNEEIAIAYRKENYQDGGPTPAFFRFDKVGVENDSLADFYLTSIMNGALVPNMTRYASPDAAMEGLRNGEVVAVMGARAQLEHGLNDALDIHQPPLPGLSLGTWTLGVAVRHSWRPLSYAVDDAVRAAVNDDRLAAIFERYGLSYSQPEW